MDNCLCGDSEKNSLPDQAWELMNKLPGVRFTKAPVHSVSDLYEKYLIGTENGAVALVLNENRLYRYDAPNRIWIPLCCSNGSGETKPEPAPEPYINVNTPSLAFDGSIRFEEKSFSVEAGNLTAAISLSWVDGSNSPVTQSVFAFDGSGLGQTGGTVKVRMTDASQSTVAIRLKITSGGITRYVNVTQQGISYAEFVSAPSENGYISLLKEADEAGGNISLGDAVKGQTLHYPADSVFGNVGEAGKQSLAFYIAKNDAWVRNCELRVTVRDNVQSVAANPCSAFSVIWGANQSEWVRSEGAGYIRYTGTGDAAAGSALNYNRFGLSFAPQDEAVYSVNLDIEFRGSTGESGTVKTLCSRQYSVSARGTVPGSISLSPVTIQFDQNDAYVTKEIAVSAAGLTSPMTVDVSPVYGDSNFDKWIEKDFSAFNSNSGGTLKFKQIDLVERNAQYDIKVSSGSEGSPNYQAQSARLVLAGGEKFNSYARYMPDYSIAATTEVGQSYVDDVTRSYWLSPSPWFDSNLQMIFKMQITRTSPASFNNIFGFRYNDHSAWTESTILGGGIELKKTAVYTNYSDLKFHFNPDREGVFTLREINFQYVSTVKDSDRFLFVRTFYAIGYTVGTPSCTFSKSSVTIASGGSETLNVECHHFRVFMEIAGVTGVSAVKSSGFDDVVGGEITLTNNTGAVITLVPGFSVLNAETQFPKCKIVFTQQ